MKWRDEGVEHPFRVWMGINTGYCNVGNFGSADRMDYTITGAEVNPAARVQSIAEPGHIVAVEGMRDARDNKVEIFSEQMPGLDFYLDPSMVNVGSEDKIRTPLHNAIAALEKYGPRPA